MSYRKQQRIQNMQGKVRSEKEKIPKERRQTAGSYHWDRTDPDFVRTGDPHRRNRRDNRTGRLKVRRLKLQLRRIRHRGSRTAGRPGHIS